MFGALMMTVFGISFSKVFSDNLWVIFLMQYCGSALVQFVFSLSFLPIYWKTSVTESATIKGILGAQCVYFTLLAMFAFIPQLPAIYGNGPVFSCQESMYPWVFTILNIGTMATGITNLCLYCPFSTRIRETIKENTPENDFVEKKGPSLCAKLFCCKKETEEEDSTNEQTMDALLDQAGPCPEAEERLAAAKLSYSQAKSFSVLVTISSTIATIIVVVTFYLKFSSNKMNYSCAGKGAAIDRS